MVGALVLLAGCSWFDGGEDLPAAAQPCPTTLILDGAARTVAYAPGRERQSNGVVHLAAMRNLDSGCSYGPEGVEVDLSLTVIVEPGPAYRGEGIDLDLFVATVGPDRRVLGKRNVGLSFAVPENGGRVGRVEEIALRLPLFSPEQGRTRRLFVGFQLTPGEARDRIDRFLR